MDNYQFTGYITPNNPTGLPVKKTKHPALIAGLVGAGYILFTIGCLVFTFFIIFNVAKTISKNQMSKHDMVTNTFYPVSKFEEINEVYDDYLSKGDSTIILGYYWLLGKDETEKVLQANGYLGWNDYLIRCGATTIKGKPSFSIWKGYMFKELDLRHGDKAVSETTVPLFD